MTERYVKGQPSASSWDNYANTSFQQLENINANPNLIPLITAVAYHSNRHRLYLDEQGRGRSSEFKQSAEVSLAELTVIIAQEMRNPEQRSTIWNYYHNNRNTRRLKKLN